MTRSSRMCAWTPCEFTPIAGRPKFIAVAKPGEPTKSSNRVWVIPEEDEYTRQSRRWSVLDAHQHPQTPTNPPTNAY